jgi:hypothetical protein
VAPDAGADALPAPTGEVVPPAEATGVRTPTKRVTKRRTTGGGPVLVEDDF